jgi:hypothetical protein
MDISEEHKIELNENGSFTTTKVTSLFGTKWVSQNTAILVVHGIGNQFPLETLDGFAKGLIETYHSSGHELRIEHHLAKKHRTGNNTPWFDNFLRIYSSGNEHYLDIYEYYWAPETEGQATLKDLNKWLSNTTKGARKFYENNVKFAKNNEDRSVFIKNQKFNAFNYWLCVNLVPNIFIFLNWIFSALFKFLSSLPVIGAIVSTLATSKVDSTIENLSNVLNDISIYNTTDPKSRFFRIKNCILDGAVDALCYLLGATENSSKSLSFRYDRVLLAGHSLGSQVAFDTINRINHLVSQAEISGYDQNGRSTVPGNPLAINDRLAGFVTFGSPLDKIAFFFREQVAENEYIRSQLLSYYHGFKQRDWLKLNGKVDKHKLIVNKRQRLFEDLHWRNYWDARDYVSGSLDYYKDVINIDCQFQSEWHSFTHSRYWTCTEMYLELIEHYLD